MRKSAKGPDIERLFKIFILELILKFVLYLSEFEQVLSPNFIRNPDDMQSNERRCYSRMASCLSVLIIFFVYSTRTFLSASYVGLAQCQTSMSCFDTQWP